MDPGPGSLRRAESLKTVSRRSEMDRQGGHETQSCPWTPSPFSHSPESLPSPYVQPEPIPFSQPPLCFSPATGSCSWTPVTASLHPPCPASLLSNTAGTSFERKKFSFPPVLNSDQAHRPTHLSGLRTPLFPHMSAPSAASHQSPVSGLGLYCSLCQEPPVLQIHTTPSSLRSFWSPPKWQLLREAPSIGGSPGCPAQHSSL